MAHFFFGKQRPPQARPELETLEARLTPSNCPNTVLHVGASETYQTINAALAVAKSGDTIKVDAGVYLEQLNITTSNIKLVGDHEKSIIEAPTTLPGSGPKAIIDVNGATNVTIKGFTIEGNPSGAVDSLEFGIKIDHGGSATITDNHIMNIRDSTLSGGQYGVGVFIGRKLENTTGFGYVYDNVIEGYQKGGVVVDNVGSSATIRDNQILGVGPTDVIAQNGIQVSNGANAKVTRNFVEGNVYTPQTTVSVGILLLSPGQVTVKDNAVTQNDYGIYLTGGTSVHLDSNFVWNSTFNGIVLTATTGVHVSGNVLLFNGSGNTGDGGILLFGVTNSYVSHNVSNHNKGDGIAIDSTSTGNTISRNTFKHNSNFDINDQSTGTGTGGTANTYRHNHFNNASVSGLK